MNDITPKEAIANLNHIYGFVSPDIQRSLDVAIKALERPTGDCISREHLVQAFKEECCGNCHLCERFAVFENGIHHCGLIDNAPAVQQNWRFYYDHGYAQAKRDFGRPKGEWEEGTQGYYCSKCNYYDQSYFEHNFCPNCGADLRKGGVENG